MSRSLSKELPRRSEDAWNKQKECVTIQGAVCLYGLSLLRTLTELDHDVDNVSSLPCDLARTLPNTNRTMIRGSADVGLTALTVLNFDLHRGRNNSACSILHPLEFQSGLSYFLKSVW